MPSITPERLREFTAALQKYKAGKASLERRVVSAENWWKLRNRFEERKGGLSDDGGYRSVSGWLHNVIVSKHADAMEAYPEPVILPREPGDREQARLLSAILPCILEQNRFEKTYDAAMWQKLKTGTACYRVVWDPDKLGGLGDIAIERVDLLNLFWEPGVADIQDSRYLFCTHLEDEDSLTERYPQLKGRLRATPFLATRFVYDDAVSLEGKATVIEVYYKKRFGGRTVLHYCKYVGDTVLYATEDGNSFQNSVFSFRETRDAGSFQETAEESTSENDQLKTENYPGGAGIYAHGRYPFVLDPLFPVEGSPCGYGFVDLCANVQTSIDLMRTAFVKNTLVGATPRYFQRIDGSVNEEEFTDLSRPLVHVSGNLGEDSLRQIGANGTMNVGVTAASAIAALQEASGKGSRDSTRASYRAFGEIVELCIELIRQFYSLPRQFRISGAGGEDYVAFSNAALTARPLGAGLGWGEPVFDVKVSAQKRNAYSRLSQNELAMELYRLGLFEQGRELQALGCLELMEFDGKDALISRLAASAQLGRQLEELARYKALAQALTRRYRPDMAQALGLAPLPEATPLSPEEGEASPLPAAEASLAQSVLGPAQPDGQAAAQAAQAPLP